ncbi:hypothetical protein [Streptomyces sp. NPDC058252]|uniref:hypothetical protein n=1 Tax=unclassified Streptomyces TaxID=2593676 RepID=UPI0036E8B394
MSKHLPLREAVLLWLEHAGSLKPASQSIVTLMLLPHWSTVVEAVAAAAPKDEQPDLYTKADGDWAPNPLTLLEQSGLSAAARLIAQGAPVPVSEVADSFVAFCTGPAPVTERWLLLNGGFDR